MTDTVEEMIREINKELNDLEKSKAVMMNILSYFGGMQVYIPKLETAFRFDFEKKIYESFNGHNHKEVVRQYNITTQKLYEIIRAFQISPKQPDLDF